LNSSSLTVTYDQRVLPLTPKEYALLLLLLHSPQQIFSSSQILDLAWPVTHHSGETAVRVIIKQLRQKLVQAGAPKDLIKTVYGMGYGLNADYKADMGSLARLRSQRERLRQTLQTSRQDLVALRGQQQALLQKSRALLQEQQQLQSCYAELRTELSELSDCLMHTKSQESV
jgi:DNA-binding winged helix-turn-helix (wHTH) protein